MKLTIDQQKCMASGRCVDILPQLFFQTEDGPAALADHHAPPHYRDLVIAAVAACPAAAIAVEKE